MIFISSLIDCLCLRSDWHSNLITEWYKSCQVLIIFSEINQSKNVNFIMKMWWNKLCFFESIDDNMSYYGKTIVDHKC